MNFFSFHATAKKIFFYKKPKTAGTSKTQLRN